MATLHVAGTRGQRTQHGDMICFIDPPLIMLNALSVDPLLFNMSHAHFHQHTVLCRRLPVLLMVIQNPPSLPCPSLSPPPPFQATFDDSLSHEAVARRHSTSSEAVAVGAAAGVFRTILTHFSQRYPKIPKLGTIQRGVMRGRGRGAEMEESRQENGATAAGNVAIAFDLMSVNFADLPKLPLVMPALQSLFGQDDDEGDEDDMA